MGRRRQSSQRRAGVSYKAGVTTSSLAANITAILEDTGTTLDNKIDTIDGIVDNIVADCVRSATWSSSSAANAGWVAGLDVSGTVIIEDIWIYGDSGADATACAIEVGDGGDELIDASDAAAGNLAAVTDRVGATADALPYLLLEGEQIGIDHTGTGATAVALTAVVKYRSIAGGSMAAS